MVSEAPERPKPRLGWVILGWLGVAGHVVMGFWYAVSGLVAPAWAVVALVAVWLGASVVIWRVMLSRPGWAVVVPMLEAGVWYAAISAGEAYLGWTA